VVTAVSDDPGSGDLQGLLPDLLAERTEWKDRDIFVCGPAGMVSRAEAVLAGLGVPAERLHHDECTCP
jgi:NAD(P)H-flavin reductase